MTYQATSGAGQYAASYTVLASSNLVDSVLGSSTKSGYNFYTSALASGTGMPATFAAAAKPVVTSGVTQTGTRNFGIATEGVLYYDTTFALFTATNSGVLSGASVVLNN